MALPPRYLFTVLETAARWGCSQIEIIDWAIAGKLELVATFPTIRVGDEVTGGLMAISGADALPMFRQFGPARSEVHIRRVREPGRDKWQVIADPAAGVVISTLDVALTASEMERFEDEHGLLRNRGGTGARTRYDWDGFYRALIRRLHDGGLPETQRELVSEMQEWFEFRSDTGEAPDESTVRKRIQAVWQDLRG